MFFRRMISRTSRVRCLTRESTRNSREGEADKLFNVFITSLSFCLPPLMLLSRLEWNWIACVRYSLELAMEVHEHLPRNDGGHVATVTQLEQDRNLTVAVVHGNAPDEVWVCFHASSKRNDERADRQTHEASYTSTDTRRQAQTSTIERRVILVRYTCGDGRHISSRGHRK